MAVDIVPGTNVFEFTHFQTFDASVIAAINTTPFTYFARVKLNGVASAGGATILHLQEPSTGLASFRLGVSGALLPAAESHDLFGSISYGATPLEIGTWHNIAGVFRNTTFRQVWLDGVSGPSNTEHSDPLPAALTKITIGATHATATQYMQPLMACVQDIVIWNRELTGEEILSLNDLEDPSSLHQTDIVFHVPFADEPTKLTAWNYTSGVPVAVTITQTGSSGTITTCEDSPEFPAPPVEGECEGEDFADEVPAVTVTWPKCDLVPEDIDVQAVSETQTPGRSLSGRQQFVQRAAGHWRIELIGIPVWTKELALQWQTLESKIDGRNGTVLVPFYEAPLSGTPIVATSPLQYPIGAVRLGILQTAGATIRAGMNFQAGERGYRIKRVLGTESGVTQVVIWPPLRDTVDAADELDFNDPHVRCRLERDDGMAIMFELLKFGKHTVAFVEDV